MSEPGSQPTCPSCRAPRMPGAPMCPQCWTPFTTTERAPVRAPGKELAIRASTAPTVLAAEPQIVRATSKVAPLVPVQFQPGHGSGEPPFPIWEATRRGPRRALIGVTALLLLAVLVATGLTWKTRGDESSVNPPTVIAGPVSGGDPAPVWERPTFAARDIRALAARLEEIRPRDGLPMGAPFSAGSAVLPPNQTDAFWAAVDPDIRRANRHLDRLQRVLVGWADGRYTYEAVSHAVGVFTLDLMEIDDFPAPARYRAAADKVEQAAREYAPVVSALNSWMSDGERTSLREFDEAASFANVRWDRALTKLYRDSGHPRPPHVHEHVAEV